MNRLLLLLFWSIPLIAKPQTISFAQVKEYLLHSQKEKIGALGKIVRKDGSLYGYQIIRLPKESLFYRLGARKGDIIVGLKTVEEIPLSSTFQLYQLLMRLEKESMVEVTYERDGKKHRKVFLNQPSSM